MKKFLMMLLVTTQLAAWEWSGYDNISYESIKIYGTNSLRIGSYVDVFHWDVWGYLVEKSYEEVLSYDPYTGFLMTSDAIYGDTRFYYVD